MRAGISNKNWMERVCCSFAQTNIKESFPIEFSFYGNNYLHLTGLKAPKGADGESAVELFANDFYQKVFGP